MSDYDVAVIGGGPGGSTLGCVLKKYRPDLRVGIFERDKFPRDHVGESQLPGIGQILDEIGAWEKVEAANFPIKIGATYRWGISDELWDFHFLPKGVFTQTERPGRYEGERRDTAWQVDRGVYDKILLDHAAELGCEVREQTSVSKVLGEDNVVQRLVLADGESVTAKYFVDASGHSGILRRAMGVKIEEPSALKNVAFWDYWQDAKWAISIGTGTRVQVMSIGFGWLWFIPVSATRTSCGLVCPAEYYKQSGLKPQELYLRAIESEPRIKALLADATREEQFSTTKDWSFVAERNVGPNWLLVGESAGFADPILAAGLALTQGSALEAAYTIMEIERGEASRDILLEMYETTTKRKIERHIRFADYWYTANAHFSELKEFTREIASDAGLDLDAEEAFRWLGTGGFLNDDTGLPGFAFFQLTSLRGVANRLSDAKVGLAVEGSNCFILKLKNAEQVVTPKYENGRVRPITGLRRDGKTLPLSGLCAGVVRGLQASTRYEDLLIYIQTQMERNGVPFTSQTYHQIVSILEGMARDGWLKAVKLDDGSPAVHISDQNRDGMVISNHDPELG